MIPRIRGISEMRDPSLLAELQLLKYVAFVNDMGLAFWFIREHGRDSSSRLGVIRNDNIHLGKPGNEAGRFDENPFYFRHFVAKRPASFPCYPLFAIVIPNETIRSLRRIVEMRDPSQQAGLLLHLPCHPEWDDPENTRDQWNEGSLPTGRIVIAFALSSRMRWSREYEGSAKWGIPLYRQNCNCINTLHLLTTWGRIFVSSVNMEGIPHHAWAWFGMTICLWRFLEGEWGGAFWWESFLLQAFRCKTPRLIPLLPPFCHCHPEWNDPEPA